MVVVNPMNDDGGHPDIDQINVEARALEGVISAGAKNAESARREEQKVVQAEMADQIEWALTEYGMPVFAAKSPQYAGAYTKERVRAVSEATAQVCIKRGWFKDGINIMASSEQWGAEIALVLALVAPAAMVWWLNSMENKTEADTVEVGK
jgi:hypothetical protein